MSLTFSIPCMKIPTCSTSKSCTHSTISSPYSYSVIIRNSQAEGPLRRPVAPPLREASSSSSVPQLLKPTIPTQPSPQRPGSVVGDDRSVVTLEFQRQKAKELQEYFKKKKLEEADQGPFFGFIGKNEISNGRWAMFGFSVGLLTEYATGSDFVDQCKTVQKHPHKDQNRPKGNSLDEIPRGPAKSRQELFNSLSLDESSVVQRIQDRNISLDEALCVQRIQVRRQQSVSSRISLDESSVVQRKWDLKQK